MYNPILKTTLTPLKGIHGRPYKSWGGSQPNNPSGWQGYCTHSSILFCPWHRPYLSLFEVSSVYYHSSNLQILTSTQQVLCEEVTKIANTFPTNTRVRYQTAASTFRAPYWDWAAIPPSGDNYFPTAASLTMASVITPQSNGQAVQIANPLYSFRFNPLNPHGNDFSNLRGTPVRYSFPGSKTSLTSISTMPGRRLFGIQLLPDL